MNRVLFVCIAALGMLGLGCQPAAQPPVEVSNAWLRAPAPGKQVTAAYMSIQNNSDAALVIDRVSSTQFARVEIHATQMQDGTMRMREQAALTIAPGERISLAPGGLHLMLFDPTDAVDAGSTVDITLATGSQPVAQLTVPVSRDNPYAD
ncbi:MAG: copper chaperone PCu(A)C [Pseudomonadota bacterium]